MDHSHDSLLSRLDQQEQAQAEEVLNRGWLDRAMLLSVVASLQTGDLAGPLHEALAQRGLISAKQRDQLADFFSCEQSYGPFVTVRKLGSGAMGDVFLARHAESEDMVALKVINRRYADDEQFVKRFTREISALRALSHPNIARAIATGSEDDRHYLALEYVPGPSLAKLVSEHGQLPVDYSLHMIIQVARGLDHVYHQAKLVHRDVKPENILSCRPPGAQAQDCLQNDDIAKLIDFGLARSFASDDRLTMTGITMGTPHYMSPEQIRGSQELDCRSDIYALGATLHHLLTGNTPYEGSSPGAVMTAHLTSPVPDPKNTRPDLDGQTRSIIRTCMAKDPKDRFANYDALIAACHKPLHHHDERPQLVRRPIREKHSPQAREAKRRQQSTDHYEAPPDPATLPADDPDLTPSKALAQVQARRASQSALERNDQDIAPEPVQANGRGFTSMLVKARNPGIGWLPWLVLVAALIALAVLLLSR